MFRINIHDILIYIVNIMFLFDIHKSEIHYVNKASNVTISCPFASTQASFQWSGPPNRTSYSDNFNVNPAVKDIEIIKGSANGVSNLIIYGFNESNEGVYQCTTAHKGKLVMHDFDVMLQTRKPTLSMSISPSNVVIEGTNVSFKCMAKSKPSPILLKLNGPDGNVLTFNNISNEEMMLGFTISDIKSTDIGNYTCTAETTVAIETASIWIKILYDPPNNKFSYSPVYITIGLGLFFTTMAFVGYLWYKSDNLKRRHEHSENRNSGQQEVNVAFNNIYGINENRQPTVHGAASASVVYSNISQNENDEALRTDRLPCRPSTCHIMPLDQQVVKQKPSELNYIEIDLDPVPQDRQFYIHGNDNRTEYSEIEIGVIGDPLQLIESESEDDNDTIDCAINA